MIWRVLARLLAWPPFEQLIIWYAKRRPFLHLGGYMHRYWCMPRCLLHRINGALEPFYAVLPFTIRVHHILRADADPYLHDHPWNWRTVILRGWYEEEDVFGTRWVRMAGDTRKASAETFHRITRVSSGGVWTLFIMGRWRNRWGFMVGDPPRKVYYRDYRSKNGRGELTHGTSI